MAIEILEGVWWLEGTRGCNVYLLRAADGSYALIDAGLERTGEAVLDEVSRIAGSALDLVLLTHRHFDHAGGAALIADRLSARIALGRGDCVEVRPGVWEAAREDRRGGLPARILRQLRRSGEPPRLLIDRPLEGRIEIAPGLEALPTPGHTPGSYCYVDRPRGVAFVGDLVISHRDGLARPLVAANGDDGEYLATLRAFAAEAPEVGLAGHGYPVRRGFGERLRELAELPREPWSARNAVNRMRRLWRFNRFLWGVDEPPRA